MNPHSDLANAYESCREVGEWREQLVELSIQRGGEPVAREAKNGLEIRNCSVKSLETLTSCQTD